MSTQTIELPLAVDNVRLGYFDVPPKHYKDADGLGRLQELLSRVVVIFASWDPKAQCQQYIVYSEAFRALGPREPLQHYQLMDDGPDTPLWLIIGEHHG